MAFPSFSKSQYHLICLAACVALSSYGITAGKPVLQIGALRLPYSEALPFPYPLTTTLFQFICIHICLLLGYLFARFIDKPLNDLGGRGIGGTKESDAFGNAAFYFDWAAILRILPLALTAAAEATLGNYVLFNMPFQTYLVSRALILPFLLLLDRFIYKNASIGRLIIPSLLLSCSVFVTAFQTPLPNSGVTILVVILSAMLTGLWPLQVQILHKDEDYLTKGEYSILGSQEIISKKSNAERYSTWSSLYYVSLISTVFLVPVVLYSGELGYILRNCYLLQEVRFWEYMVAGAFFRLGFFASMMMLVQKTSALDASFFYVLVSVMQVVGFTFSPLERVQLFGLTASCLLALWYLITSTYFDHTWGPVWNISHPVSRQRLYLVVLLATVVIGLGTVAQICYNTQIVDTSPPHDRDDTGDFPASLFTAMVEGNDSYLGSRPPTNSVIDLHRLMEECGGISSSVSKDVFRCLEFLSTKESTYLVPPSGIPLARSDNEDLEVADKTASIATTEASTDMCDGQIILYHIWGDHSPTWRIELFIKAYLYTQNLHCSRLWIWIDGRHRADTLSKWLLDGRFQRFMPLIESGDIIVKEWTLSARVPLPPRNTLDEVDQARYYKVPGQANSKGEKLVADYVIEDALGQEWLQFYEVEHQITYYNKAISDVARFTIVHMHGGIYLDSGAILLRDIRPLLLSNVPLIEKPDPQEPFGNSFIALPANSSVSSYMLRGGTRMGLFFHAAILQRMFVKEGRDGNNYSAGGLIRLEDAILDPIWAESHGLREGRCTIPCLSEYVHIFKAAPVPNEWESFDGESLGGGAYNRTMENFFRGAFAYHIHGQKKVQYERGSWMDVICSAHDRWFAGIQSNSYGEKWEGPPITTYRHSFR